ncbi:MAG: SpaH/EbpB family LPXTG-anchored major pilin [Eubacteriales bacterium]
MKKIVSIVLCAMMIFSLGIAVFAADDVGSITITNAKNVSVEGKTFNAYKILDLELVGSDGYVYTVPAALESFYADEFSIDASSGDFDYEVAQAIAEMSNDSDELFAFAAKALAAAKTAGIVPETVTGAEGAVSVSFEDISLGYYVIEDAGAAKPISALMLNSADPDVEIKLKADKPVIDKKIDGNTDTDDSTEGLVDYNNAAIGDKVPYVLTSAVPDMTGYTRYYYVVTDVLSKGLTFNNDVAITVGDEALTEDEDYTVTVTVNKDGTTSVKIVFVNFIQYKAQDGDAIVITYSATVDEDAVIGTVGNPNKVVLKYSNNPNHDESGNSGDEPGPDSPVGETPEDETRTFVTELSVIKVDPDGKRLTGAEFTLTGEKLNKVIVTKEVFTEDKTGEYWKLTDGTYTTAEPTDETADSYESTTVTYKKDTVGEVITKSESVAVSGTVGTDGVLTFTGLSAGTYKITEIKAPNGYNLLDDPITVTVGWEAPADGETECIWTYGGTDTVNETNVNTVTVINQAGAKLPSTGGIGTKIFYIAGGVIVAAAAVLLITRRRMGNRN